MAIRSYRFVRRVLPLLAALAALAPVVGCVVHPAGLSVTESDDPVRGDRPAVAAAAAAAVPIDFRGRGRIVCLAEAMKELHGARIPAVHEHLLGLRVERGLEPLVAGAERAAARDASPRFLTILRAAGSEALFADEKFHEHTLVLNGRVFPEASILEVSGWRWVRDGQLFDVYYWCDICAIRGIDPGPCACCQAPVELREDSSGPDPDAPSSGGG